VQARCAELTVTSSLQIGTGASVVLAPHGTVTSVHHDGSCPANQVITGLEGATGQWIERVYVYCAPLAVRQVSGRPTAVVEAPTRMEVPLGPPTPNPFAAVHCPAGAIAVGIEGNSGFAVDLLALRCARPTLR